MTVAGLLSSTAAPPPIWPPNYAEAFHKRKRRLRRLKHSAGARHRANLYYSSRPVEWINDWVLTYNPRNKKGIPRTLPFLLFPRQVDFVHFLQACLNDGESGLVEKARDIGATWLCCAFSIWLWLYHPGTSVGWGSRKEALVDRIGDPDSIFEKMRMIIKKLPLWMIPDGFDVKRHAVYMKLINPANGSTITGESGDNIGRGGRSTIYFKDESAHYEHPELIEAALGDNTDVQIDISSVNGTGNIFYRRRMSGQIWEPGAVMEPNKTRVFIFDWRDHPGKTQEWYDGRRAKMEREGLLHIFAQEVDRDYTSAIEGIIIPAKWIKASIDAHKKLGFGDEGERISALDVADGGGDSNAQAIRYGVILRHLAKWAQADDVGESTRLAINNCAIHGVSEFYYDGIGIGAGVKAETNRLGDEELLPPYLRVMPWIASADPLNKEDNLIPGDDKSPIIGQILLNLKSQGWFSLRQRFEKTYKAVTYGIKYDPEELISIDSQIEYLWQLVTELSQPVWKKNPAKGKMTVDKTPEGTPSPNLADCVMMCYHPTRELSILDVL